MHSFNGNITLNISAIYNLLSSYFNIAVGPLNITRNHHELPKTTF